MHVNIQKYECEGSLQEILDTLARAVQPNEVTQAAQHALSPMLSGPPSTPRLRPEHSTTWPFSQPPPGPSMSPPVASLFDQVRHAASEQPSPGGLSAHEAAPEEASGEASAATSMSQQQRAHDSQVTPFQDSSNHIGIVSSSSNDVASQAHDRSSAAQGQSQKCQSQPQLTLENGSSSSSNEPLPGRFPDSTACMPTMSIGYEGFCVWPRYCCCSTRAGD